MEDKNINDRYRKFKTSESARHLDNEISEETVKVMTDVVVDNYKIVQDFYKFKKKLMKNHEKKRNQHLYCLRFQSKR